MGYLVPRRHVEYWQSSSRRCHKALIVDILQVHLGAVNVEDASRIAKTRVLHANAHTARHQQAGQQIERVLRTEGDQNLVGPRPDAALGQHAGALKDTAFLTIITVQELTAAANSVQATYFIPSEAFIVVIALYWVISICLELALKWASRFGAKRGFEHA